MKFQEDDIIEYKGYGDESYIVCVTKVGNSIVYHDGPTRHPEGSVTVKNGYFMYQSRAYKTARLIQR